jgi:UDP-N-acetylmuramoylalanine--D-glutamate ligase
MIRSSIDRPPLPAGPFLVVGLARSGQAAAAMLAERGERVLGVDSGSPAGVEGMREAGVEVSLDAEGVELLEEVNAVVKSPGVPEQAPAIALARDRGKPVLGELELAWRALPNPFVAVTGTNGKTTVTEWLGHLWREAGEEVAVAGNVGTPLSSLVDEIDAPTAVVCECSSFQLEDSEAFAPEVAVFLNFAPDHLDRHPSLGDYLNAKLRIFANQGEGSVAVWDADEPALGRRLPGGGGRPAPYGIAACAEEGMDCAVSLSDGLLRTQRGPLVAVDELALPGEHNLRNAMAVAAAALSAGIEEPAVAAGLRSFGGVPHRLERVAEVKGVAYVNDSKATNVSAAVAALDSYEHGVRAILGGSLKGGGFEGLPPAIARSCEACYLIGEAAGALRRALTGTGVELVDSGTLERAVADAARDAAPGETVLLAPACASFDAFRDFEQRGERFRELVEGLR